MNLGPFLRNSILLLAFLGFSLWYVRYCPAPDPRATMTISQQEKHRERNQRRANLMQRMKQAAMEAAKHPTLGEVRIVEHREAAAIPPP